MTTDTESTSTKGKAVPVPKDQEAPKKRGLGSLLRRSRDFSDEIEVALVTPEATTPAKPATAATRAAVDLSAFSARMWCLIGPNGVGKTFVARRLAELSNGQQKEITLAALDPQNRALADFFDDVLQPTRPDPTDPSREVPTRDPVAVARWAMQYMRHVRDEQWGGYTDFGGGDTSLNTVLDTLPNLSGEMEEAGIALVAAYAIGTRPADLTQLANFEAKGFKPRARVLMLNEGVSKDPTMPREEAFARVLRHSAFRRAVDEGAEVLWVPRLDAAIAAEIEGKRLLFREAMEEDRIDPWDAAQVRLWDKEFMARLERFRTWLP